MRVSPEFCREQQAIHHARASLELLENRRNIALVAARAWGAEALLAEKRASGKEPLDRLDAEIALEFEGEEPAPPSFQPLTNR